jgi:hypothetical protein
MGTREGVDLGGMLGLVSLAGSLQPLKEYFNNHGHKLRFLTLLSPT